VTVRKNDALAWPRAETATDYIAMATDPDLKVATTAAIQEMVDFLAANKSLTRHEAYQLVSIGRNVAITQLVESPGRRRPREAAEEHFQVARRIPNSKFLIVNF
jgi:acetamidase/formamidase